MRYITLIAISLFLAGCSNSNKEDNFLISCNYESESGIALFSDYHNYVNYKYYEFDFSQNIVFINARFYDELNNPTKKGTITRSNLAYIEFSKRYEDWSEDGSNGFAQQENYILDRITLELYLETKEQWFYGEEARADIMNMSVKEYRATEEQIRADAMAMSVEEYRGLYEGGDTSGATVWVDGTNPKVNMQFKCTTPKV